MRSLASSATLLGVLLVAAPDVGARPPGKTRIQRKAVRLITATARIRRGRVRRARGAATHRALLAAVWEWVEPRLASGKGRRRLKRHISRRVRKLIRWFRTRKISRKGARLTVLLAVILDEQAIRARLEALGAPLKKPGVLILAHCDLGDLERPISAALGRRSIQVVRGPWSADRRREMVVTAASNLPKVAAWARAANGAAVVVARCESRALGSIVAAGVTGVRVKVVVQAMALGGPKGMRMLMHLSQTGLGHHAEERRAGALALGRALAKVSVALAKGLGAKLPSGPSRALLVRLRGPVDLGSVLRIARSLTVQLKGVSVVRPRRFVRGSTWLSVETVHSPRRLLELLRTLQPPPGWALKVAPGKVSGTLDLVATVAEDGS